MTLDVLETIIDWPQTAFACTAERQGIWTLWWRYEMIRASFDQVEQLNTDDLIVGSDANLTLNNVEISIDSLMSIREKLGVNGLVLLEAL